MTSRTSGLANQRLLLVHAHPDDETIGSGATMAKYVAAGVQVTFWPLNTSYAGDESKGVRVGGGR